MTINIDTDADYVLEAYWWSHKLVGKVVKRNKKFVKRKLGRRKKRRNR